MLLQTDDDESILQNIYIELKAGSWKNYSVNDIPVSEVWEVFHEQRCSQLKDTRKHNKAHSN